MASREKDRVFVTTLLVEKMVDQDVLLSRVSMLPLESDRIATIRRWVALITGEID